MNYKSYMMTATYVTMTLCVMVMGYWLSLASDAYYVVKHKPARERITFYVQKPAQPAAKKKQANKKERPTLKTAQLATTQAPNKTKG